MYMMQKDNYSLHTVGVVGSIPTAPTNFSLILFNNFIRVAVNTLQIYAEHCKNMRQFCGKIAGKCSPSVHDESRLIQSPVASRYWSGE